MATNRNIKTAISSVCPADKESGETVLYYYQGCINLGAFSPGENFEGWKNENFLSLKYRCYYIIIYKQYNMCFSTNEWSL